jgi:hypothetical protein
MLYGRTPHPRSLPTEVRRGKYLHCGAVSGCQEKGLTPPCLKRYMFKSYLLPLPKERGKSPAPLGINQGMRDAAPALQYRNKEYGIPKRERRQGGGYHLRYTTLTPTLSRQRERGILVICGQRISCKKVAKIKKGFLCPHDNNL